MDARSKTHCSRVLLLIVGAALSLTLLGGDTSSAQAAPELSFVTSGEEPLRVDLENLENNEKGLLGTVDTVLLNDSNYEGPLTIEFIDRESGEAIALGNAQVFPKDRLGFFTTGPVQPSVRPIATLPVPLKFSADKEKFAQESVEGVVVAKATDGTPVRPATLQVTVVGPEAASRWSQVKIEPASVTIIATRVWPTPLRTLLPEWLQPLWSFNREGPTWIRDVGPGTNVAAGSEIASTRLSSDTGGTSTLTLVTQHHVPNEASEEVEGIVRVTDISRAGSYAGSLALDPVVETSPKVTVALKARDLILWPFMVLLGGAGVAWLLVIRRDQERPKQLLISEITKAFDKYKKAKDANPDCDYHLGSVFPEQGRLKSCKDEEVNRPKAQIAYCGIKDAKTKEDLDQQVAQIRDIQELVALWPEICRTAKELKDALEGIPDDVRIREETEKLLGKKELPAEVKANKDLLEKYRQQTLAVIQWAQGRKLYESVLGLYQDLLSRKEDMTASDREQLHKNDPEILYRYYLESAVNLDDLIKQDSVAKMRASAYVLASLDKAYPKGRMVEDVEEQELVALHETERLLVTETLSAAPQSLTKALLASTPPEVVVSRVRAQDWREFLLTAGLTTAAYMVTLYTSTNFGSVWQYISAFLAGAAGPLAINWTLLPWYRSYRGVSSTPTK